MRSRRRSTAGVLLAALALCILLVVLQPEPVRGQSPGTYTVQPGDTLGIIAARFGVTVDALAAANGILDVNLIDVGQVLAIPGTGDSATSAAAWPGESLTQAAARLGIPPAQLAALNQLEPGARLFPGQPLQLPPGAAVQIPLRFGAVQRVTLPDQIVQGRTGRLAVTSSRPLSLTATWNGLPLATRMADADGLRQVAFLPTPALLGPGVFPVEIGYAAGAGLIISRTFSVPVAAGVYDAQLIELPDEKGGLLDPEFTLPEIEKLYALWSMSDGPLLWTAPFSRPIGVEFPTTSPYGIRRSYNGGPYNNFHSGHDYGAPAGITVTAPGDGIVVLAEALNVRGNSVVIDHGAGLYSGYWHLTDTFVSAGQAITVGTPLGTVGTTGLSTGNHLHWEVRIYTVAVDPLQFLEEGLGEWQGEDGQ